MDDSYVIAVDFGTAYSGYAYNLTPRGKEVDPQLKCWGEEVSKDTPKTPTCILFNEHEEFLKFGYDAQMAYSEMCGEEATKHFFFSCFKMSLYDTKLNRDVTIKAANGRSMKALKVFTAALRYMKEDALKTINENTHGMKFNASDFTWVLTVPAIWDPSAKQFMREAATKAGIVTEETKDKLLIALEPEAASVWCKKLPAEGFITQNHGGHRLDQTPGTQYAVVDCGGGTIDMTVHEVLRGGALKELDKASGNDMGGQRVDRKFKEFLREIFCDGVWDEYEREFPSEVQRMMYDFTVLKKKTDKDVQITCQYNLGEIAKKKKKMEQFFERVQGASWNSGSIKITEAKMKSFFDESLTSITKSLREILKKDLSIEFILLVGGYAESEILRQHIIREFKLKCKVVCPARPQEAIVKGAVMFGANPAVVASRKSAFTYGIAVAERFNKFRHKVEKKFTTKDGDWCNDIFMKLVDTGEDVRWDETRKHTFTPLEADYTIMGFRFYQTARTTAPLYVDDWGMEEIGSFSVDMPDVTGGMNREVKLEIRFGFTEMTATATDMNTMTTASVTLDFMTQS